MLVFNLTGGEVTYKGRKIPPHGGSVDFRDLTHIPTRDRELETAKVLAFGALPAWWHQQKALKATVVQATVMKPGVMNANGDVFPERVVTMEAPAEQLKEQGPVSMGTSERKKK
jgi:hypothetical protein